MPKQTVGIDFGTYTIKIVQARPGRKIFVEKTAQVFNTVGTNVAADEAMTLKLVELITNVFNDYALARGDVRLSLPEYLVSTKIIEIPALSDAELASAITWQAEQHIPIPLDELSLEYQVLSRPTHHEKGAMMRVLLVGARKKVVEDFTDLFLRAGIEPTMLETHTVSLLRSLQFTVEDPPTLVVSIGAFHTDMMVVDKGEVRFVYTHPSGGQALTRTIEQAAQLDSKQAEEYKRTYGLDPSALQGRMREILLPPVKASVDEMRKAIQFFISENPTSQVKRVLLAGGGSQLPGFVEYVAEQLSAEGLVAAPFATAEGEVPKTDHPTFGICMGLVMRELK